MNKTEIRSYTGQVNCNHDTRNYYTSIAIEICDKSYETVEHVYKINPGCPQVSGKQNPEETEWAQCINSVIHLERGLCSWVPSA